ncbi:chromate efflux transporter [uncultured Pseudoxanthomonas sp.]|uniref:chromate efflux transporter n=1 Tax=uncultured Pseudoxanthomonas sp. TaxID=281701 RepID=UPI00263333B4|nr:chromate efflux transporter [uncultured Pseudoxanthomonas sp.]
MRGMTAREPRQQASAWRVFRVFLRLGLVSFGGPIAHLGYFRDEFVARRQWLTDSAYAELVALCQFLPGPASSQVGMAIGLSQAGIRGAVAAWCGFTLPSAVLMVLFALGLVHWGSALPAESLHGFKWVAVAVVAQAVWTMGRMFCIDAPRVLMAVATTLVVVWWPHAWVQWLLIAVGAMTGLALRRASDTAGADGMAVLLSARTGVAMLVAFLILLLLLPWVARYSMEPAVQVFDAFYRTGALVFGGGHVVLPLLQAEVVAPGWIGTGEFLAGYGFAQALPGPLFAFSAFLGTAMSAGPGGWLGAMVCLLAIFLPSFLLIVGVLPFWSRVRRQRGAQAAVAGVNAVVVGLLLAALHDPLWTTAVRDWRDVAWIAVGVVMLMWAKLPPWLVVLLLGLGGAASAWLSA